MISSLSTKAYDVLVVGSGPAGSTAAYLLAKHGMRIALIEKKVLPRHKTCGGGVVQRAIQCLPVDVSEVMERECFRVTLDLGKQGLQFSTERTAPIISMTNRDTFDHFLAMEAQKAGAELFQECRALNITKRSDHVELLTTRGCMKARFLVVATGALGFPFKRRRLEETRRLVPALECKVTMDQKRSERYGDRAWFDFGVLPDGYAWIFPKKTTLSVGVLDMRRTGVRLDLILSRYLRAKGFQEESEPRKRAFIIPVTPRRDGFVKGRAFLIGDAAGLADPLIGEGISFSVLSGTLAAEALIKGNLFYDDVKVLYESMLSEKLLKELHLSRILAKIVYNTPRAFHTLFRLYGQDFLEAVTDVAMGLGSYKRKLSDPLNYLQLLKFWGRKNPSLIT
jgi:geranylgeranyl reductase family protein